MTKFKKGSLVALLLLLTLGLAGLLFQRTIHECWSILTTRRGTAEYLLAASDTEDNYYALGCTDSTYQLVKLDRSGTRQEVWELSDLPSAIRPVALYPAAGGAVYLGLYDISTQPAVLQVLRLTGKGKEVERLLQRTCQGDSLAEQIASVRLSAFSEVDNVVTFAVLSDGYAHFYQRTSAASGLENIRQISEPSLHTAVALSDGSFVLASEDRLSRTGYAAIPLNHGEKIIQFTQAGTGIYYVDGASLEVFYTNFADWSPYRFLDLKKDAYDLDACNSLWITRDGDALLLLDGNRLLLDRKNDVLDLSSGLFYSGSRCVLTLLGLLLGVLAVTTVLWYLLGEQRKFRLPLLVRWGALTVVVAVLSTGALLRWIVAPSCREAAKQEAFGFMGSLVSLTVQEHVDWKEDTVSRLQNSFTSAGNGLYTDATVLICRMDAERNWSLTIPSMGLPAGCQALFHPSFDLEHANKARQKGSDCWVAQRGSETRYLFARAEGRNLLITDVGGTALLAREQENYAWMRRELCALAGLWTALTCAILCWITIGVRKVTKGMERLASGERGVQLQLAGGDELTSLAEDLNALARTMEDMERMQKKLSESYRRFVPERVLFLLGKRSITEVNKQTCVSRKLATMMLTFQFPPEVYEKSGKELFDNINEIIERTASIVTKKGGAVFNFAYNGYDAVFEKGNAAALSTAVAVQQEILEINQKRELECKPPVTMRIALDEGDVMIGVVGDEHQIETTSISSSFSTVQHLVELCGKLKAHILCTENIIKDAKGYGSRYIGKCTESGETIRVYEIFDGDPYDIRQGKESTGSRFSKGVYALYSHNFSQAKRIFLSLVQRNSGDGGAQYYLYLADRMEKRPEEEITLDSGQ